jgi:hypothetical protein
MRKVWDNDAMSIFGSQLCRDNMVGGKARPRALGRVSGRSGKAVARVRQSQNKLRAARFAGCLTLPGQKERELCVSGSGGLDDIPQAPVKVDLLAKDGKDQGDARDESRQIKPNQTCGLAGWGRCIGRETRQKAQKFLWLCDFGTLSRKFP